MKDLIDSVDLMLSPDHKDRLKAEYWQLHIRMNRLFDILQNWDNLEFKPKCGKDTLNMQYHYMKKYEEILIHRALLEGVDLDGADE